MSRHKAYVLLIGVISVFDALIAVNYLVSYKVSFLSLSLSLFREKRLEAKQVIRMHGNETIITSKEGVVHRFHYDNCFWSFDPSHVRCDNAF